MSAAPTSNSSTMLCKSQHPLGPPGIVPLSIFATIRRQRRRATRAQCCTNRHILRARPVSSHCRSSQPPVGAITDRPYIPIISRYRSPRCISPKYPHIRPLSPRLFVSLHKLATDFSHKMQIENPVKLYYNSVTETIKYTPRTSFIRRSPCKRVAQFPSNFLID